MKIQVEIEISDAEVRRLAEERAKGFFGDYYNSDGKKMVNAAFDRAINTPEVQGQIEELCRVEILREAKWKVQGKVAASVRESVGRVLAEMKRNGTLDTLVSKVLKESPDA